VSNTCTKCVAGKYKNTRDNAACSSCDAGKYSATEGASQASACLSCPALSSSPSGSDLPTKCQCNAGYTGTNGGSCTACLEGTYKNTGGAATCTQCGAGKYSDTIGRSSCLDCVFPQGAFVAPNFNAVGSGAATCGDCWEGTYADRTSASDLGASACSTCAPGYHLDPLVRAEVTFAGATKSKPCKPCLKCPDIDGKPAKTWGCSNTGTSAGSCSSCAAGQYYAVSREICDACEEGKYQSVETMQNHEDACELCPSYSRGIYTLSTSPRGSIDVSACSCNAAKGFLNPPRLVGTPCVCGPGKVYKNGVCESSPADTYQPFEDAAEGTPCPLGAQAPAGSLRIADCQCSRGTVRKTDLTTFRCECPEGKYLKNNECEICEGCSFREWRQGCTVDQGGSCVQCGPCEAGKYRVGCNWVHAGTCEDKQWLSPEPLCPKVASTTTRQEVGVMQDLGGFGFEDVFGVSSERANFACGEVCDGTTTRDGTQCGGPFACGVRTCVEEMRADMSVTGSRYDILVCPVTISSEDSDDVKRLKTKEPCVSCDECGATDAARDSTQMDLLWRNWGDGCARECSRLRCAGSDIWDWTVKKCVGCDDLHDQRLCTAESRDRLQLGSMLVTGYLPLLYFEGCSAGGALSKITYGECHRCADPEGRCRDAASFPESCGPLESASAGPRNLPTGCGVCVRSFRGDVGVVQGRYAPQLGAGDASLYCQITPCKSIAGAQRTGVRQNAICFERCRALVCGQEQVLVACRLPHQTRCDTAWPAGAEVARVFAGAPRNAMAGPEVNLFSEAPGGTADGAADEAGASGYASFENTLITLTVPSEHYQCVWNAARIPDNKAFPGGISEYLFPPASAYAGSKRGSKACELWDLDREGGDAPLPVLPLQNTVSGASSRRVMVNTEAHVLSYEYDCAFSGVNEGTYDVSMSRTFCDDTHKIQYTLSIPTV
jgi:hypothetical protein